MDTIYRFFEEYIDQTRPILLGLSGGADSICLLHLLIEWRKKHPVEIHLVHVDHGWREESALEAKELEELAQSLQLSIHITRLDPSGYKGNLEAQSRKERFGYFLTVQNSVQAQGILLGHHADDQTETVFKRMLEGASLPYLSGMDPLATIDSLIVIRPLLTVGKKEVLEWLSLRHITYFQDATNDDPKFLRAKMRTAIFPFLRDAFGKEFDRNLCEIAKEALEFRHYLDQLIAPVIEKGLESDWGFMIDMENLRFPFEQAYLLRKLCGKFHIKVSRYQVRLAINALLSKQANVQIVTGKKSVICDRGNIFFIEDLSQDVPDFQPLMLGVQQYGDWQIIATLVKSCNIHFFKNSWKDAWKGSCSTVLPEGNYFLRKAEPQMRRTVLTGENREAKGSKALNRFLNEKKVPHFLISKVPMILSPDGVVEDFLSGNKAGKYDGPCLHIAMKRESHGFKD